MPKLIMFAVCEKVIVDDQGNPSLVVILQSITATPREGTEIEIPKNAVASKEWAVFALWKPLAEDRGKPFLQVVQALWPDGSEFKRTELPFKFEDKNHQIRLSIIGFPVGQTGNVTINVWLELDAKRVGEVHSWSVSVIHDKKATSH